MAIIYLALLTVDFIWYISDPHISFPFNRKGEKLTNSLFLAIIGYAIFLLINAMTKVFFFNETFSLFSGVQEMSALPILAGSVAMTWVGWTIVIPFIETSFFHGRLFEGLAQLSNRLFNKPKSLRVLSLGLIGVATAVSVIFAVFHSKVTLSPIITIFIFSMVSCYLVIKEQKLTAAILLHILANTAALAVKYGLI
ncbi:CPBP family intramembrane metalloprotease [Candidatus Woesearchaeota archaeon]|nr:CPBP family intramembrane metalloprotease [Candidatus Woesearchaeota archaeon]